MKTTKRQRKIEKQISMQKELRKKKAGIPYSRKKIHICKHYTETGSVPIYSDIVSMFGSYPLSIKSFLHPMNDRECQCEKCGKIFPMEAYQEFNAWIEKHNDFRFHSEYADCARLSDICKASQCYYVAENKIKYID